MDNPSVLDMIRAALKTGGYDGLVNGVEPCGCGIDDIAPCGNCDLDECMAAYKRTDAPDPESETACYIEPGQVWYSTEKQV